jgi:hypothetical protein
MDNMPITDEECLKYVFIPSFIVILLAIYSIYYGYLSVLFGMMIIGVFAWLPITIYTFAEIINTDEENQMQREFALNSYFEQYASIEAAKRINEEWSNQI